MDVSRLGRKDWRDWEGSRTGKRKGQRGGRRQWYVVGEASGALRRQTAATR